jgi:hypothetical protein
MKSLLINGEVYSKEQSKKSNIDACIFLKGIKLCKV